MRLIGAFATASAATTEVLHRREMSRTANIARWSEMKEAAN
jgi:hypothetical protein